MKRELESPGQVNEYLLPTNNLVFWHLLEVADQESPGGGNDLVSPVLPDPGVRDYLAGGMTTGALLSVHGEVISSGPELEEILIREEIKRKLENVLTSRAEEKNRLLFLFSGPGTRNKLETAFVLAENRKSAVLYLELKQFFKTPDSFETRFMNVVREARLFGLSIYLDGCDILETTEYKNYKPIIADSLRVGGVSCYIAAEKPLRFPVEGLQEPLVEIRFSYPEYKLRRRMWQRHWAGDAALADHLAANFILTEDEILQAINLAGRQNFITGDMENALFVACRTQRHHNLQDMAMKVDYPFSFSDIVLPEDTLELLKEITFFYKSKDSLFHDWGFSRKLPYGQGVTALFSGPSGTGKTMAASIIANELGLEMYRVDLATVVSKYIGETEKNLKRIFDEARASNVILFFDEADAVFGKRTEVKDAHDRYANIETSYMLQMMEEYDGMTVLATNYRDNIDEAFTRRIRFIVEFPFPDRDHRERIWSISFPADAPVAEDVDYPFLARKVEMAGGNIKSIALMAAMFAFRQNKAIGMLHIIRGIRREYQRHGKSFIKADFMPYYHLLENDGGI